MNPYRKMQRTIILGVAALVWVFAAGCANRVTVVSPTETGFVDEREVIQVITTNVQGKNVYIPSNIVVTAGRQQRLSIYNTTDTPHGFRIASLGIEAVLVNGEETEIALPALKSGSVYQIDCQLHPPHRHGTLVVLPYE